jgi:hypothetical protein
MLLACSSELTIFKNFGSTIRVATAAQHTQIFQSEGVLHESSWMNNAQIPAVLSTDIPTQMEPNFFNKKLKFCVPL